MKTKDPDMFDKRGLYLGSSTETFNQGEWRLTKKDYRMYKQQSRNRCKLNRKQFKFDKLSEKIHT